MKQLLQHPRFVQMLMGFAGLAILAWVSFGFLSRAKPKQGLENAQAAFVEAVAKNQRGKAGKFVHHEYSDSLGHDRAMALSRLFELRAQIQELSLEAKVVELVELNDQEGEAKLVMQFTQLEGGGGLFGDQLVPLLHRSGVLDTKVSTSWKRSGIWPGSWKLINLEFDERLRMPVNYEPNKSLKEQMSSGLSF